MLPVSFYLFMKYAFKIAEEYEFAVGEVYSDSYVKVSLLRDELFFEPTENRKAVVVYLKKTCK